MSDELKACPWCGKLPEWSDYYHCYRCANLDCMCDCHSYTASSKEKQQEQWNTRPIEDALRASLAASQAEVERLRGIIRRAEFGKSVHTAWDKYQRCAVCGNKQSSGHDVNCPFYQWEGGAK